MAFSIINFYKFVELDELGSLSESHYAAAAEAGLVGTIMIAPEGINVGLAGARDGLEAYERFVKSDPRFADVIFKWSEGRARPFKGLYVKIKPWIIRFAEEAPLSVAEITEGERIAPAEFRRLLQERPEDVVIIDTRNNYETDYGKFEGAVTLKDMEKFTQFPEVFEKEFGDQRDKTFVFYCTGGVRCEKVVPWAKRAGFPNARQLDGGILGYFEEFGPEAYDGTCFVFDRRWMVDGHLKEADDVGLNLRIQPKVYREG